MRVALVVVALALGACTARTGMPTTHTLIPSAAVHAIDPFEPYPFGRHRLTGDARVERRFAAWDGERVVGDDEVARGRFDAWDVDDDGVLDPSEVAAARDDLSPDVVEGRLAAVEDSPNVTDVEVREGAPNLDAFAYWDRDADGVLTPDELTESMIAAWDEDDDGVVDPREWPG